MHKFSKYFRFGIWYRIDLGVNLLAACGALHGNEWVQIRAVSVWIALDVKDHCLQAHNLIGEIEDPQLTLQYKACYARICDSKRKFLEAATQYYDLSQSGAGVQCVSSIHS